MARSYSGSTAQEQVVTAAASFFVCLPFRRWVRAAPLCPPESAPGHGGCALAMLQTHAPHYRHADAQQHHSSAIFLLTVKCTRVGVHTLLRSWHRAAPGR